MKCPYCNGTGRYSDSSKSVPCLACNGKGYLDEIPMPNVEPALPVPRLVGTEDDGEMD